MQSRFFTAFLILFCVAITPVYALDGWVKSHRDGYLVYIPENLDKNKTLQFASAPPEQLGRQSLRAWFQKKITAMQRELGKPPLQPWTIKPEKNDMLAATNSYLSDDGSKFTVSYYGGYLDQQRVYVVQVIASPHLSVLRYLFAFDDVDKDMRESLIRGDLVAAAESTTSTKASAVHVPKAVDEKPKANKKPLPKKEVASLIRSEPGQGLKNHALETVLYDSHIDVLRGGLEPTVYFLYKDGTAYVDADIPPDDFNVDQSRSLEGKDKWTEWRKRSGKYQIKRRKDGQWETLGADQAVEGRRGERLKKRYSSFSGSANFGSHQAHITFFANGTFETSAKSIMGGGPYTPVGPSVSTASRSDKSGTRSVVVTAGKNVGGGVSGKKNDGSKNTGTYHIDGYTIELHHDNGYEHRELFLFKDRDKDTILIGDEVYWVRKK